MIESNRRLLRGLSSLITIIPTTFFLFISFVVPGFLLEGQELILALPYLKVARNILGTLLLLGFVVCNLYLFLSNVVPKDKRALWFFVLLMGNVLATPVFWFWYLWPAKRSITDS